MARLLRLKMLYVLCGYICLFCPDALLAAPAQTAATRLTPAPIVNVWRDWRSEDGQFFLTLRSGVWQPSGTLFFLKKKGGRSVEGFQKGHNLSLASFNPEIGLLAEPEYTLSGLLDSVNNTFTATVTDHTKHTTHNTTFQPAIKITDRPLLNFRFYGFQDDWHRDWITRIEVIDQKSRQPIQQLVGFTAQGYSLDYMDVNYDGYFDLVLQTGKNVEDSTYVYWLYHPQSRRFQRNARFESMQGYPNRYPHKQQIHYTNGLFHIHHDQWQPVPCCYADD